MKNIVIIQGHPDPSGNRLCHALAKAYADGAREAGHKVDIVEPAQIAFPLLQTQEEWKSGIETTPDGLKPAQRCCIEADHFVLIYPLWLGAMPALLKGFLEQVFRPGVALSQGEKFPKPLMKGKSARIVVTMGMPVLAYRFYFFAHSLKNLQRNILGFVGIRPIRSTLFGMVDSADSAKRRRWLTTMSLYGRQAR